MFEQRMRWEWYRHAKVQQELERELHKARTPEVLKGELASALVCLCTGKGRAPAELGRRGPIRVLDVCAIQQHLYVFFAPALDSRCYIGLHVVFLLGPQLPSNLEYSLAKSRLESSER
jgi:hypothetical protein